MIDPEVARLRRLRTAALRMRAIARALSSTRWAMSDPLLARGAWSSWRIARAVSGRLMAHPYVRYQKSAGIGSRVRDRILAVILAVSTRNRKRALLEFESHLHGLARQLDDARALTWSSDLSDTFGRLQIEIKSLMLALAHETKSALYSERSPQRSSRTGAAAGNLAPTIAGDWPYLAF